MLAARLRAESPITVARLFELAVGDAVTGHYARAPAFGAEGDFVTAPEISQTFGELMGLALVDAWARAGGPTAITLAELGPGRGTLLQDAWRAAAKVPAFGASATVHLVETSPRLRAVQATALAALTPTWHDDVGTLPSDRPLFLIANEFLDALPVHQLVRTADGWVERGVATAEDAVAWTLLAAPPQLAQAAAARFPRATPGDVVELAPRRTQVVIDVTRRIVARGGLALFVDYGGVVERPFDTVQAVARHDRVSPLDHLGAADLSSSVDFGPLVEAALGTGAAVFGPTAQATVLRALGIELRALHLAGGRRGEARAAVMAGVRRLLDPRAMGELFKVLAIVPASSDAPPGFAAHDRR